MSLRVLALRRFYPQDLAALRGKLNPGIELIEPEAYTSDALAAAAARGADVILGGAVTEPVLAAAKGLKLMQVPWTGVDTLDLPLLRRFGVKVCNSHSNAETVAEYAVSLLLAALKSIPEHDALLRRGGWARPRRDGSGAFRPPRRLRGTTVGFVGCGAIARAGARLLQGFAVRLIAVAARERAKPTPPFEYVRGVERLGSLLEESDAVIVAAPSTSRSRGLLNAGALERLKPHALLVNISRADLIDEGALYAALRDGKIGAAALDTWNQAPGEGAAGSEVLMPSRFPFHELSNVVLSPHRAGFSAQELPHLADAAENINRLAAGQPLINSVDLEAGY